MLFLFVLILRVVKMVGKGGGFPSQTTREKNVMCFILHFRFFFGFVSC